MANFRRLVAYTTCLSVFFQSVSPCLAGFLGASEVDVGALATSFHIRLLSCQMNVKEGSTPPVFPVLQIAAAATKDSLLSPREGPVPDPLKPPLASYKSYLWLGKPVSFTLKSGLSLEWITPQLFKLTGTSTSSDPTSLSLDLPTSGLLLKDLDMESLTLKTAYTAIQDSVNLQTFQTSSPTRITPQGRLQVTHLKLKRGTLLNEGSLSSGAESVIHVHQKARLLNKGTVEQQEASLWKGKGRVLNQKSGTLAFKEAATFQDLHLLNEGLLTTLSRFKGSLASLENKGTFSTPLLDAFVIQEFINRGVFQGNGHLTLKGPSRNAHQLQGTGLQLEIQEMLTNTQLLSIQGLLGTGVIKNEGDLLTTEALPLTLHYHNTGSIEAPAYMPQPHEAFPYASGRWKFKSFYLPDQEEPYVLKTDAQLELFSLTTRNSSKPTTFINQSHLTFGHCSNPHLSLLNEGELSILKSLNLKHLHNTSRLRGTGVWDVEEFLNDGTFESWGTHTIKGKTFTNTKDIMSSDEAHLFTLGFETLTNGKSPLSSTLTPEQVKTHLASLHTRGRVNFKIKGDLENRWGTLYGNKGIEILSSQGQLLNGAPLTSQKCTTVAKQYSSGPFFMNDWEWGTKIQACFSRNSALYGLTQGGGFTHPFSSPNGAFIATDGALKIHAQGLANTFGTLFSKAPFEIFLKEEALFKGGFLYGQGGRLKASSLNVLTEVPYQATLIYHPVPCWSPRRGACPNYLRYHSLDTSQGSLIDLEGDLHLEVPHVKVEGSEVRTSGTLTLNKEKFQGTLPADASLSVLVSPSGKGARIASYGGVFATTGHVAITGNVGGWSLHLDTRSLSLLYPLAYLSRETTEGARTPQLTGPVTVNLTQWAQSKSHLLKSSGSTYCLPWEDDTREAHRASAFWAERAAIPHPLTLSPALLTFAIRDAAFTVWGLKGLNPKLLSHLSQSVQHNQEATSLIPYTPQASGLTLQKKEGCETFDPLLHLSPQEFVEQQLASDVATLWAKEELQTTSTEATLLHGGQMVSLRNSSSHQEKPALSVKAQTLVTSPVIETRGEGQWDSLKQTIYDVCVRKSKILAPYQDLRLEADLSQTHCATDLGARTQLDLITTNPDESGIQYLPQTLHSWTRSEEQEEKSSFWGSKTITTTRVFHQTSLEPTQVLCEKGEIRTRSASQILQEASHVKAGQKILYKAPQTQIKAVPLLTSSSTTIEKEGTWCSSSRHTAMTQGSLYPSTIEAEEDVTWEGQTALLEGTLVKGRKGIDDTHSLTIREAKTESRYTHDYSRSLTFRDDDVSQEVGQEVLLPSVLLFEQWKSLAHDSQESELTLFQGVRGQLGLGRFQKNLTIQDARQKSWAKQSIQSSGLLGGPFEAEPLKNAIQGMKGTHHPMIQLAGAIQLTTATIGTLQDLFTTARALGNGDLLAALFSPLSRYTTLTFGTQSSSSETTQDTPFRSQVGFKKLKVKTRGFQSRVSFQGEIQVKDKALIRTSHLTVKHSLSTSSSQSTQESNTCGVNFLTLTATLGSSASGSETTIKTPSASTFSTPLLDLITDTLALEGSEVQLREGRVKIGECLIRGALQEITQESWSEGFSFTVPLCPTSTGSLSALNLMQGGVSGSSLGRTLATGWNLQQETTSRHIRRQTGIPGFYALNRETGELRPLTGTIEHLHTQGQAHLDLGDVEVGRHTSEALPELDEEDSSGFALPMGTLTSLWHQGEWINTQLGSSSSSSSSHTESMEGLTLKQQKAHDTLSEHGYTDTQIQTILSDPHVQQMFREGQAFDTYDTPASKAHRDLTSQYASHNSYAKELREYQQSRGPWNITITEGSALTIQERAVVLTRQAALWVDEAATHHPDLIGGIILVSQLAIAGPLKALQGLAADALMGQTAHQLTQNLLTAGLETLGLSSYAYAGGLSEVASVLNFAGAYAIGGPRSVVSAARDVKTAFSYNKAYTSPVAFSSSAAHKAQPSPYLDAAIHQPKGGGLNKTAPQKSSQPKLDGQLYQEHHIISDKSRFTRDHPLWELAGVKPSDRMNRMFLPTKKGEAVSTTQRSIHQGRHRDIINEKLAEQMKQKVEQGTREGWTQVQYRNALEEIIKVERGSLKSGERILNKHHREWGVPLSRDIFK